MDSHYGRKDRREGEAIQQGLTRNVSFFVLVRNFFPCVCLIKHEFSKTGGGREASMFGLSTLNIL